MKQYLPGIRFTAIILLVCVSILFILSLGCGRDDSPRRQYYQSAQKKRPYPAQQVNRAKDMMDQGYELYRQALNSTEQQEKNALIDEALNKYYFPAQETLEQTKAKYPEHASDIDSLHQVLSQRISDAVRTTGN
jgi:hypothetical protein